MARITRPLVTILTLYLVLLPAFGMPAAAQPPAAPPGLEARPIQPGPPEGRRSFFHPQTPPITFNAFNGFGSETVNGQFVHGDHVHAGGIGRIDSPWGEELGFRYWLTPHGFAIEYDGELTVRYRFDDSGTLASIIAETPERRVRSEIGNRAQLAYLGQLDPADLDMSAYLLIEETLRSRHSTSFLDGLATFDAAAPASCGTSALLCGACIVGWIGTVAGLIAGCTAGGVITFGLACFTAMIAHETTSLTCAGACIQTWEDCRSQGPDGQPIDEGCDGPPGDS